MLSWAKNISQEDAAAKIEAIDDALDVVHSLVNQCSKALAGEDGRLFVAERLARFGTVIIPSLKEVFLTAQDEEVKALAGTVLLQLGDHTAVEMLLESLSPENEHTTLIITHLSKAGVTETVEPALNILDSCRTDELVLLLSALDRLQAKVPDGVRERLVRRVLTALEEAPLSNFGQIRYLVDVLERLEQDLPDHLRLRYSEDEILRKIL